MKRATFVLTLFAASSIYAQQASEPTEEQLKALVTILRQQRDQAVQAYQDTQAQLQLVNAELAKLKNMVAAKSGTESLSK